MSEHYVFSFDRDETQDDFCGVFGVTRELVDEFNDKIIKTFMDKLIVAAKDRSIFTDAKLIWTELVMDTIKSLPDDKVGEVIMVEEIGREHD